MLNLNFTIQGTDGADPLVKAQARGVVAALLSIYGSDILPPGAISISGGVISVATGVGGGGGGGSRPVVELVGGGGSSGPMPSVTQGYGAGGAAAAFAPVDPQADALGEDEPDPAAAFGAAPTSAPAGAATRRDKNGLPWDKRIHSGDDAESAGTNQDGSWKRRRNTPDELFNSVMAELKGANTQATIAAVQGAGLVPPPPSPVPAPPTAPPAPSPAPVAPDASLNAPAAVNFPGIMVKVTQAQTAQKLKADELKNLLLSVGAGSIIDLNKNPALIPAFDALLDDHLSRA